MKVYNTPHSLSHKQREPMLDFLQETATIGLWKVDLLTAKPTWCHITKRIHEVDDNYDPTIETTINFYKPGYSQDKITEVLQDCYTNFTQYDVELQIITAKGQEKWVRTIGLPIIEEGKCIAMHGLIQDIDEKTTILKMLSFKEEQFRKTFEYAILGMALLNLDGHWIKVNKGLTEMLGYTQDEFKILGFSDLTHPEERHLYNIQRLITGRIENYQAEKRLIHKNGSIVYTMVSVSLVRDDMGEPLNFVAQINNLSDFRKASDKVVDLLKTSESQNKRLLNFAHIVSHNLRSHYTKIDMLINLIGLNIPGLKDKPLFGMLNTAIKNLDETINNLNAIALIDSHSVEEIKTVNVLTYINNALTLVNAAVIKANAKININVDKELTVKVIPAYFESILLNLITNAIKYRSEQRQLVLSISGSVLDNWVQIQISDNGLGIDLKTQGEKIFEMYTTFNNDKDARGLGLFITKNQVDAMGGEIKVSSEEERGTTFKVLLKHDK